MSSCSQQNGQVMTWGCSSNVVVYGCRRVTRQPLQTFILGVIGLSALLGMVPITALTIIGIPFVPFALLAIIVAWTLGYLLAAYGVARRVLVAFNGDEDPSLLMKLVIVALAICAVAILNFIPFVGWVVNYTLVLLGVGAITAGLLSIWIPDPDPALDVRSLNVSLLLNTLVCLFLMA